MNEEIRTFCVEFALPVFILTICAVLLLTGIDGEVKTILAGAAGWIFKSGYSKRKAKPAKTTHQDEDPGVSP